MIHADEAVQEGYTYRHEQGMIVSVHGHGLHLVTGSTGAVEFPKEVIWDLHKRQPGIIHQLAHTHPPGIWELSQRDKMMLRAWAFAVYPFPMRMSVITCMGEYFNRMTALAVLESKESWIHRGKTGKRDFQIIIEENHPFNWLNDEPIWVNTMLSESYQPR